MELLTKASCQFDPNERELRNRQIAYRAACEGIVLLKNEGVLPLNCQKIALYGAGVEFTTKGGTGSGEVNERYSVNVLEGFENRGYEVTTKPWLADLRTAYEKAKEEFLRKQKETILKLKIHSVMDMLFACNPIPDSRPICVKDIEDSDTDTCVYVLSRQAGEGGDRKLTKGDYYITDAERTDIEVCAKNYKNFVLVINSGAQIDLGFADEIDGIGAIVYICQLGSEGGNALADVLSGAVSPSGKLTDTWAKSYQDIPFGENFSYLNGDLDNEDYSEGIYVGYRYFDSFGIHPRYPFGYGLSYTDFAIEMLDAVADGTAVTVTAQVTNIGQTAGKEVVQLYVSAPAGKLHKEYQQLVAFAKTPLLQSGESADVTLRFQMESVASYDEMAAAFLLEQGDYLLRLGNSSRDTVVCAVVELDTTVRVSVHKHICPVKTILSELISQPAQPERQAHVKRITLDPSAFETVIHRYPEPEMCSDVRVRTFVNSLSTAQMTKIVVGSGMFGGKHRFDLPGSVGNTTSAFWDRGLANVALCDGPAGLRVQKRSTVTAKGEIKMVDTPMSVYDLIPQFARKLIFGNPEKETIVYQHTTAFPVATAIAQSWNTPMAEEIGRGIYEEMKEYGCTYWLAPAMNIHRNPLCGRNFEYFSEDPFLTGAMAAAITRGVQQEPGFYVTVKHFACNNQEDHRNTVSSNISERALREIYLRGFEMAVKEGGAKSVMTSYNKVNGVYTPNSYDLCTDVLRNEWGFDGVVMTDWFSTNPGLGKNDLCIKAGNDLIMPGTPMAEMEIRMGLKKGTITPKELKRCCANVVRSIFNSAIQREYREQ